ncbi:hypothetical protein C8Q76DRAFT_113879 [Earliella scabrosa]|nr:hypothetical protein C8Q76DRAFT_113879 [Earliella scabrosa]
MPTTTNSTVSTTMSMSTTSEVTHITSPTHLNGHDVSPSSSLPPENGTTWSSYTSISTPSTSQSDSQTRTPVNTSPSSLALSAANTANHAGANGTSFAQTPHTLPNVQITTTVITFTDGRISTYVTVTSYHDKPTIFTLQPTEAASSAHAAGITREAIAGVAVALVVFFLLVIAVLVFLWRRRRHPQIVFSPASSPSQLALSTSFTEEALPPYAPSTTGSTTQSRPASVSEKSGLAPLPQYGYTAHEPQVPDDSEFECRQGRISTESDHPVPAIQPQEPLVPLRRRASE